jgi:hypothetical protein
MAATKGWASSLAEAKRGRLIDMTGPSGARFTLRTLTLDEIVAEEGLPEDLLNIALLQLIPGGVMVEAMEKRADPKTRNEAKKLSVDSFRLADRIALRAIVAPKVTAKDVAALDGFDKQMIVDICQRRITLDATGRRVGANALATFRELALEWSVDPDSEAFAGAVRKVASLQ